MESSRTQKYRKNYKIESGLKTLNDQLARLLLDVGIEGKEPKKPIIFVVGLQRSGTTLLMQLLTQYFNFTFPDNIIARLWRVPYVGVLISRGLKHQIKSPSDQNFHSDYGVTHDTFGPHEFGYFWKNYFKFEPTHYLAIEHLNQINLSELKRNLFLMEYFGESPLLFKAVPLSFNCDFLAENFPNSIFINTQRNPLHIATSTYLARIERYGNPNVWWSLKPKQYNELIKLPPLEQVACQVKYSLESIHNCLKGIQPERKVNVSYESLCKNPVKVLENIGKRFGHLVKKSNSKIPTSFEIRKNDKIEPKALQGLKKYFNEFNLQQFCM
jgi:hypothetical protein